MPFDHRDEIVQDFVGGEPPVARPDAHDFPAAALEEFDAVDVALQNAFAGVERLIITFDAEDVALQFGVVNAERKFVVGIAEVNVDFIP